MWDNMSSIIGAAGTNELTLLALVVITLSLLGFALFRKEDAQLKVKVFLLIFFGSLLVVNIPRVTEYFSENATKENLIQSQEAVFLLRLGDQYQLSNMNKKAREIYSEARDLFGKLPDLRGEASALTKLGLLEFKLGKTDKAKEMLSDAITLFEKSGDQIGKVNVLASIEKINIEIDSAQNNIAITQHNFAEQNVILARDTVELAGYIAQKSDLSIGDSTNAVKLMFEGITDTLALGQSVRLPNFGTFSVAQRNASQGRNPRTGEIISIPASKQPKFKAGKLLKDTVNQ